MTGLIQLDGFKVSNQKLKSENYNQMGGINSKMSPYLTTPIEFLNLINMDFQMPGSLTQRWGSTQYVSQNFNSPVTSLFEFAMLNGSSFVVVGASGALWVGATTGQAQGLSFIGSSFYEVTQSITLGTNLFSGPYIDVNIIGSPSGSRSIKNLPFFGLYNQSSGTGGLSLTVQGQTLTNNKYSFAVLNNYMFAANGDSFFKFNGTTTSFVGAPPIQPYITRTLGSSVINTTSATLIGMGVSSGSYAYYGSFVNDRGFEGQIWPLSCINVTQFSAASLGGSFCQIESAIFVPPQYDIQSINLYSFFNSSTMSIGSTTFWNNPYGFLTNYPLSALATTLSVANFGTSNIAYLLQLGSTIGGQTALISNSGAFPDTNTNTYFPLGFTMVIGAGANTPSQVNSIQINPYHPRFLETYQNQLFLAGFSSAPSIVQFSDIGEPEGYLLTNNFEVRTNDGDHITGLRSYSSRLYIFKLHSFHILFGDNPLNFYLNEVSDQYGCLNNNCTAVFNNTLLFLDQKGVCVYNGASVEMLSNKVQPIFDRMNYLAAINSACMVHDKIRNQVLICIPVDGSTINNLTVVYDYLLNAWTTYDGVSPTIIHSIQGRNNAKNAFYGTSSGLLNWFGPSFLSDNGTGFTSYAKSRFLHDLGESIQEQYRRLYINIDPLSSGTMTFNINFFQDFGSSIVKSVTLNEANFQQRIDFGISAKSLAFEISTVQTNSVLRLHGFTIESRLQRRV